MLKPRCVVFALALLLATLADSSAKSRHNPDPNSQSQSATQPPASDQRGTEQSPAFIKIIPPPKTAAEENKQANYREEKAWADLWIIRWTGAVALFTLVLAGVGIWQGIQFKRSVDLARKEFIAARRPRLKIREIEWDNSLGVPPIKISFAVINVGDTPAHIFERRNRIYFTQTDASLHGLAGWTRDQMCREKITLHGGGRGYFQYETPGIIDDKWPNRVAEGTLGLKLVGEIRYLDDNGVERWVGFLHQYDWELRRFRIMDDPDHEYQTRKISAPACRSHLKPCLDRLSSTG